MHVSLVVAILSLLCVAACAFARPIALITGEEVTDGENVTVRRFVGNDRTPPAGARSADPFLVFDFYNSSSPRGAAPKAKPSRRASAEEAELDIDDEGDDAEDDDFDGTAAVAAVVPRRTFRFPAHPHAGFVEIRYLLDGEMHHLDSCGVTGTVRGGQLHVLRAMRGIAHEETLRESSANGRLRGFQLWLDVPAAEKRSTRASYRVVADIPVVRRDIADGEWSLLARCIATDGPKEGRDTDDDATSGGDNASSSSSTTTTITPSDCPVSATKDMSLGHFVMMDVALVREKLVPRRAAGTVVFTHAVSPGTAASTCVVFSLAGFFSVAVTNEAQLRHVAPGQLFVTVLGAGDEISVVADANGTRLRGVGDELRVLIACAPPLRQRVFKWQGLVFSEREALDDAVNRLKSGTFDADC